MSDNQDGAGAPDQEPTDQQQSAGAQAATGEQQSAAREPSANKLIKDFATARGVTVEKLLDQFSEMENAGKTELERLTNERDSLKGKYESLAARYKTATARAAVTEAAGRLNAIDGHAVFAIARDSLEFDGESGEPTNVEAVLKDVQKRHPALFRAANGSGDGGKGGASQNVGNVNDLFREMARTAT
jgi:hypothetical protein